MSEEKKYRIPRLDILEKNIKLNEERIELLYKLCDNLQKQVKNLENFISLIK